MKITDKTSYLILEDEKNNVKGFANYLQNIAYDSIKDKNLIIDIQKYGKLTLEQLLLFLEPSNRHRASRYSFVIVNDTINIDDVPEELIVVPTLREAKDILKMEEIERDLEAF